MAAKIDRRALRRAILTEMKDIIADDALFTQKDVPGDAPVGDVDEGDDGDCGCGCGGAPGGCGDSKVGTRTGTALFKRSLYEIIEDAVNIYDHYDDADEISEDMIRDVAHIHNVLHRLRGH